MRALIAWKRHLQHMRARDLLYVHLHYSQCRSRILITHSPSPGTSRATRKAIFIHVALHSVDAAGFFFLRSSHCVVPCIAILSHPALFRFLPARDQHFASLGFPGLLRQGQALLTLLTFYVIGPSLHLSHARFSFRICFLLHFLFL